MRDSYDHGYYYVATFIEEHIKHHAKYLSAWLVAGTWSDIRRRWTDLRSTLIITVYTCISTSSSVYKIGQCKMEIR
jgi:hypothetical protein